MSKLVNQYADKVGEYKETSDKAVKALLKKDINQIKTIVSENAQLELFDGKYSESIYHNSLEWMLEFPEVWNENKEFVGFDVVIGNPPYIFNRNLDENVREIYSRRVGKTDSYVYFIYLGLSITRVGGILSFITPNTYFTLTSHTDVRKELLKYGNLDITYTGYCFDNAYVETVIFQLTNQANETGMLSYYDSLETTSCYECDKQMFKKNIMCRFFVPNEQNVAIYSGIQSGLSDIYDKYKRIINRDARITSDVRKKSMRLYSEKLGEGTLTFLGLISDGDQGLVTGNNSKYLGIICDDSTRADEIDNSFLEILNRIINSCIKFKVTYMSKVDTALSGFDKFAQIIFTVCTIRTCTESQTIVRIINSLKHTANPFLTCNDTWKTKYWPSRIIWMNCHINIVFIADWHNCF